MYSPRTVEVDWEFPTHVQRVQGFDRTTSVTISVHTGEAAPGVFIGDESLGVEIVYEDENPVDRVIHNGLYLPPGTVINLENFEGAIYAISDDQGDVTEPEDGEPAYVTVWARGRGA